MSMEMQHVSYVYETGTSYEQTALHDINLKTNTGSGSGSSDIPVPGYPL